MLKTFATPMYSQPSSVPVWKEVIGGREQTINNGHENSSNTIDHRSQDASNCAEDRFDLLSSVLMSIPSRERRQGRGAHA